MGTPMYQSFLVYTYRGTHRGLPNQGALTYEYLYIFIYRDTPHIRDSHVFEFSYTSDPLYAVTPIYEPLYTGPPI